ncbi:hypothetical protein BBK36DRAFT_1163638 [Trichoderma citrinoviride]|uniref:Uncharacterized protein n=1 Tax=Trichoderma citrinoviride TaxID=58853 RepID=A0A2T4AXK6_9HYPO|nr:hypothetical protein BBK36DRAFT_1163638 [Trichoderma citrinoviride]PTB61793.1 hypothetical protein BBK36DRAFT_1163638 [Trichoderma citrinoviride]
MSFYGFVPGFTAQKLQPPQYHVFQHPVMAVPSPPVLTIQNPQHQLVQPVVPLTTMILVSPPPIFAVPVALPPSLPLATASALPPGAPTGAVSSSSSSGERRLNMRIVFYGHPDGRYALTDTSWSRDELPSRDGLLAALARFAKQHHGIAIRHAGGRIDASRVKVYVMPQGSRAREGGLCGLRVEKGAEGLVTPGDVVRVLGADVDEGVWEGGLRGVMEEGGNEVVVGVDMGVAGDGDGDGNGDGDGGGDGGASA